MFPLNHSKLSLLGLLVFAAGCESEPPAPVMPQEACQSSLAMDVLPGTYPNTLEPGATGVLEVAVLGTEALDARALEPGLARLSEPAGKARSVTAASLEPRDVNGDGQTDGVLSFSVPALVEAGVLHPEVSRLRLDVTASGGAELSGCDRAHMAGHALVQLPAPTGTHAVGTTAYHWIDSTRPEPFTETEEDVRELMVRVWYPAEPRPGSQPAPYFLQRREGVANTSGFQMPGHLFDFVHAHAVAEAPLAGAQARYPVVLFSPGSAVPPVLYTGLLEDVASHGYVVVALSHTYASGPVA
ncbi:MAG TPA: hypothetical protein VF815_04855, partial [Myxococcaceae bacterium]